MFLWNVDKENNNTTNIRRNKELQMTHKIVKAVFIGEDGSLNYEKDKQYTLKIEHSQINRKIWATDMFGEGKECIYESVVAFLNNWTEIKTK